jgi:type II secretory pathway component PulF
MTDPKVPPESTPEEPRRASRFGIRHMMLAVFWIAIAMFLGINFGRLLLLIFLTFVPVAVVVGVIVALFKRQAAEQDGLLRVMSLATQRRLPLSQGIDAFADLCSFSTRRRNLALAYLLEAGVPLPQALASVPGVLPSSAVVLACVGWNEGALPEALSEAVAAQEVSRIYRWTFVPKLGYLATIFLVMQVILGFVFYFIAPKFEVIFFDFDMPLPAITRFVIQASHWTLIPGAFLLLILLQIVLWVYIPFRYFGWIQWEVPFSAWLFHRRDAAAVLRSLSIGVTAGRPLPATLDLLGRFYPRSRIRYRLVVASRRIEGGMPWYDALRRSGIIRRGEAAVLEAAQRAGNLGWALRLLAESNERRLGYRLQLFSQALFPALILLMGVVIGTVCIAYFTPLVYLIERLAQ